MSTIRLLLILLLCLMPDAAVPATADSAETLDIRDDAIQLQRRRRVIPTVWDLPAYVLERPRQTSTIRLRRCAATRLRRPIANRQIRKIPPVCDSLSASEDH